jgi:hypothetical protein
MLYVWLHDENHIYEFVNFHIFFLHFWLLKTFKNHFLEFWILNFIFLQYVSSKKKILYTHNFGWNVAIKLCEVAILTLPLRLLRVVTKSID